MSAPRIDMLVSDLCEEVDYWKNLFVEERARADRLQRELNDTNTRAIRHGETMMGHLLVAALNGNLTPTPPKDGAGHPAAVG